MKKAIFNDEFYHEIAELTECNCHIEATELIAKKYYDKVFSMSMKNGGNPEREYFLHRMAMRLRESLCRIIGLRTDNRNYETGEDAELHLMYQEIVMQIIQDVFGEDEYNYVHNCL